MYDEPQGLLEEAHESIGELQEEVASLGRHIEALTSSSGSPGQGDAAVRDKVGSCYHV